MRILDWTGSEIHQLQRILDCRLDPEMCNVYPIFRDLRQFLLVVTLTSEVLYLISSAIHIIVYFSHIDFTRYLVGTCSVVSGLDWTGFKFWIISWIGLD